MIGKQNRRSSIKRVPECKRTNRVIGVRAEEAWMGFLEPNYLGDEWQLDPELLAVQDGTLRALGKL